MKKANIFRHVCFLKDGWGGDPEPYDDEEDDCEPGIFGWKNGKDKEDTTNKG